MDVSAPSPQPQPWVLFRYSLDGGDWVLALGRIRGEGRSSGVAIDARAGWVARFSDGRVTSFHTYPDRAEALEAVGLSE